MLSVLDAVLSGTVTYQAWDEFVCVPIRSDPRLEEVRAKCSALDEDRSLFYKGGKEWRGDAGFNAMGLRWIKEIRDALAEEMP